ncbi:MAG: ATP-dependent DNA helicase [Firmicutes bacterium]|nr:ATP-dependent DNA helicase [Bacillota bacterium]
MPKKEINISIRNLIEFVLRSGDIDSRFVGKSRAVEGTKAHQRVQNKSDDNYTPEVTLKKTIEYDEFLLNVQGRADGIITEDQLVIIDEIKSTTKPLEKIDENYNIMHWAQAKCYGYIYLTDNDMEKITIQLTYYHLDTEEIKQLKKEYTKKELEDFFYDILDKYFIWADIITKWESERDKSIRDMDFPFESYRDGQRKMAVGVYKSILDNKSLYIEAPTGIGKTISTLFPTIKAMGEKLTSKIFYLTAKTITRQVAEETSLIMLNKGLKLKTLTLTAKDKICFKEESNCNPDDCEFAKGHFNRVNEALLDIFKNEVSLTRKVIEDYAKKYKVCPFEFSLDLTLFSDCVICDYNYVFDPRVYLKRFFLDNSGDYIFLIDEAHNLVDRSRDMFSAKLNKQRFLDVRRLIKDKNKKIAKALKKVNNKMLDIKKKCEDSFLVQSEEPDDIYYPLRNFIKESESFLTENRAKKGYDDLLELYFDSLAFLKISEFFDERYKTYAFINGKDLELKLFCLDPSFLLKEAIKRGKSAVFFSATLTPIKYYRDILGGNEEDNIMKLSSPFDRKNLELLIASNISTKYRFREFSYFSIAEYIKGVSDGKKGNYLVFFPSYKYMESVYEVFKENYPNIKTMTQSKAMTELEREDFLDEFILNPKETLVVFAVLGGIFSEGIDLKGERLSGAIIVGVGLPRICYERDIIKDYFTKKKNLGFEYAYMYPGMNKVLQASGRVIRTHNDKGIVLLIDERFIYRGYKNLFPKKWFPYKLVKNKENLEREVKNFWK